MQHYFPILRGGLSFHSIVRYAHLFACRYWHHEYWVHKTRKIVSITAKKGSDPNHRFPITITHLIMFFNFIKIYTSSNKYYTRSLVRIRAIYFLLFYLKQKTPRKIHHIKTEAAVRLVLSKTMSTYKYIFASFYNHQSREG